MMNRLLDRLEGKVGRHKGVRNLMTIISVGIAIVFVADLFLPQLLGGTALSDYLRFDKAAIMRGQIWRLLTFVFVPMSSNLLWLIFSLYFLCIPIIYLAAASRRIRGRMKQLGTERISYGQRSLNLLPVLLLGLIAVCGIMRLVIAEEQRYWITHDNFFYGSPVGFSQAEDSVVNSLKEQHARSWPKR